TTLFRSRAGCVLQLFECRRVASCGRARTRARTAVRVLASRASPRGASVPRPALGALFRAGKSHLRGDRRSAGVIRARFVYVSRSARRRVADGERDAASVLERYLERLLALMEVYQCWLIRV